MNTGLTFPRKLGGLLFLTLSVALASAQRSDRPAPYASTVPLREPTVFGPGVISTGDYDTHPAFTPDGQTLYFIRSTPDFNYWAILVSHFAKDRWSTPEVAPFSGQYSDADPFITADGSRLYFISNRPVTGKKVPDLDIWMVEKTEKGWSEPQNLGVPISSPGNEWYPTIAANGTIYFGSDREGGKGRNDIYRSRLVNGKYEAAENLGAAINTQFNEYEPLIAPDESFLIFMCGGRADGRGGFDLYLSYNRNGEWSIPENLGDKINSAGNEYSPTISPDGKYFFWGSTRGFAGQPFTRRQSYLELMDKLRGPGNGSGDIYQIDLAELKIKK